MENYKLYVGGYSNDFAGLYQVMFNSKSQEFEVLSTNNETINPVHIEIKDNYLFTANEIMEVARVSSFKIEKSGALRLVNRIDGPGSETCHISIEDNVVYASNYGSGNIFSVPFEKDGNLIEVMSNMEHTGKEPRAHSTILSKDGKHLYEANLGNDRIYHYEVYPEGILRTDSDKKSTKLADFEGPRRMVIDSLGQYVYIVNEFGNSVYSFSINNDTGVLNLVEKISLTEKVESYAADIQFGKNNNHLYASLRGSDEIVLLEVNKGKMQVKGRYYTGGRYPRNFKVSNDGKYIFVANQNTNNITALKINLDDGSLSEALTSLKINRPTTISEYK